MNKLVGGLAFSTLAFAGATLYLANEWRVEETRAAQRAARSMPAPASRPQSSRSPLRSPQSRRPAERIEPIAPIELIERGQRGGPSERGDGGPHSVGVSSAVPASTPAVTAAAGAQRVLSHEEHEALVEAQTLEARKQYSARLLKRYEDPRERDMLLEAAKADQRYVLGRFPQIASLTDEDADQLLNALGQVRLQNSLKVARCLLEPDCTRPRKETEVADSEDTRQQITAVLGPEIALRYEAFRSSSLDRITVTTFRARLGDGQMLGDVDTEHLIEALADERHKYIRELEQRGAKVDTFNYSGVAFAVPVPADARYGAVDAKAASDFSERMRRRASQVLSADQLRVFANLQDDVVSQIRERGRDRQYTKMYQSPDVEAQK